MQGRFFTKAFKYDSREIGSGEYSYTEYSLPIKKIKDAIKGFGLLGYEVIGMSCTEPMYIDVDTEFYPQYKSIPTEDLERLYKDIRSHIKSIPIKVGRNGLTTDIIGYDIKLNDSFNDMYADEKQITIRFEIKEV